MSGYSGYSKSNNAIEAERFGRFPATKAAPILGVPVGFLKEHAPSNEWHHTSKEFNCTPYYNLEDCQEWLTDPEAQAELIKWKSARKAEPVTYTGVTVEWIDWVGTRSHPRAIQRREEGCTVTDKHGKMVFITRPGGSTMRKGKETRGFEMTDKEGSTLWL